MKKLLLAILGFAFLSAQAQTAEEVIRQYATTLGGLDAFNKVNTAKLTGTLRSQGRDLPIITQIVNGKSMRADVTVGEQAVHNVYNNGTGWKINPFANAPTAADVTGSELVTFKAQASLANNLMDYKQRGHTVELVGEADVEGIKTYQIKLTNKDDAKVTNYFISKADNLLIKSVTARDIAGTSYDAETFYSDFKDISGLKFCMHFITKIAGQVFQEVTYEKIELNIPVDPKIFERPK
jgi:hypothetical protein